jgi:hypothetical protein
VEEDRAAGTAAAAAAGLSAMCVAIAQAGRERYENPKGRRGGSQWRRRAEVLVVVEGCRDECSLMRESICAQSVTSAVVDDRFTLIIESGKLGEGAVE